jgi:hypothetical protein
MAFSLEMMVGDIASFPLAVSRFIPEPFFPLPEHQNLPKKGNSAGLEFPLPNNCDPTQRITASGMNSCMIALDQYRLPRREAACLYLPPTCSQQVPARRSVLSRETGA